MAKGLDYHVDPKWDLIYVEKSKLQKTRDYAIRTLATPVAVVIDAATTVVVVGCAVCLASHDNRPSDEVEAERQWHEASNRQKEMDTINNLLDDMRQQE